MTLPTLAAIFVLVGYAVYQQTRRHEVVAGSRFKLAITYAIVGLAVGGMNPPENPLSLVFLLASISLSLAVGYVRGRLTRVWVSNGHAYSQGTRTTVQLFLLLIALKFALGALAYTLDVSDDGGIGEVLIMIAGMVAVQAELVWRRAEQLLDGLAAVHRPAVR